MPGHESPDGVTVWAFRGTARMWARHVMVGHGTPCPYVEQFGKPAAGSLATIIRSFKSSVTKCINEIRNSPGIARMAT